MKVSKTEIRFKTGFQQPKIGLPKTPVLTSLVKIFIKINLKTKVVYLYSRRCYLLLFL